MDYVILAGGLGSRFVKEGYECPKPLVPLLGKPMLGLLVDILMRQDADRIFVGANANMPRLIDYLDSLSKSGLPVITRPIVTDNSFCTLKVASRGIEGKFIALTCDAVFLPDEFARYRDCVMKSRPDVAVMGLTRFVEDESPLYAKLSEDGEIVDYKYGGEPFAGDVIISAGIYGLSGDIMKSVEENGLQPSSLSDFQRLLAAESPVSVVPYEFSIAFDVDNTADRKHAESFLSSFINS